MLQEMHQDVPAADLCESRLETLHITRTPFLSLDLGAIMRAGELLDLNIRCDEMKIKIHQHWPPKLTPARNQREIKLSVWKGFEPDDREALEKLGFVVEKGTQLTDFEEKPEEISEATLRNTCTRTASVTTSDTPRTSLSDLIQPMTSPQDKEAAYDKKAGQLASGVRMLRGPPICMVCNSLFCHMLKSRPGNSLASADLQAELLSFTR